MYLAFLTKSDFNSNQVVFIRILFFSIALALPFVMINAFAFANFNNFDLKFYLKSKQKLNVLVPIDRLNDFNEIKLKLCNLKWKVIDEKDNFIIFKKSNYFINDIIKYKINNKNANNYDIEITSKPSLKLLFIDFARNYRNILVVLKTIQKN
ncbi:MAG: hypothetical protein IT243_05525 [Bacteroidia bacterium]|nr:hypothetical protein [Bacteroidia bacterium]